MAWPIPTAKEIFLRFAGTLEAGILRIREDLDPIALSRAVRSARGMFSWIGRTVSLELREVHDHLAWWGRQYFPDTAEEEFVLRHAGIWGVEQRPAIKAIGTVTIEGIAGEPLPAGIELSASNAVVYVTSAAAVIGAGGTVIVAAEASVAGSAGNLETGIRLVTVAPYPAISKVTVETAFSGGADEQSPEELQVATLQRIRQPPHGGAGFDYPIWIGSAFSVKAVKVVPEWIGRGSLATVIIMKNADGSARVPTVEEVDAIETHLGQFGSNTGVRPVTARAIVVPGTLRALPITVRLRPDTVLTRAAVTEAYARFIATIGDEEDDQNDGPIGALIEPSRISEALSAAGGEYAHDLIVPAASFTLEQTEYPLAGIITFEVA
ncbi:MAG: baseplate J/gp47 family protein [Rhizobium sp.]